MRRRLWLAGATLCALTGCNASSADGGGFSSSDFDPPEPPAPPTAPPGTGTKWQGVEVQGECGQTTIVWVLVDEICAGTSDPDYFDHFRAPMLRDGARIGDHLFTVDGTGLWALDVTADDAPFRASLSQGYGTPIGAAALGDRLLIAAADGGLLLVDVDDPSSPAVLQKVSLPGPAMKVTVRGDRILVAAGAGGVLELAQDESGTLGIEKHFALPGFAASIDAAGDNAVVAMCDSVVMMDWSDGTTLGSTWVQTPYQEEILIAPAKDIAVQGDLAYVAAGRYGTVVVDVSDPSSPVIRGNHTAPGLLSYYVSGVRVHEGTVFSAAGEWGLDSRAIDAYEFSTLNVPYALLLPGSGQDCDPEPPWKSVGWVDTWAPPFPQLPDPPPPGYDPLQSLPYGDIVYAFGDARRNAIRSVDIWTTQGSALGDKAGRYEEPRVITGVAVSDERLLVTGTHGNLLSLEGAPLSVTPDDLEAIREAIAGAFTEDGRWVVISGDGRLRAEGMEESIPMRYDVWPNGLVTRGNSALIATKTGALEMDIDSRKGAVYDSGQLANLPLSIAVGAHSVAVAAPEWAQALVVEPEVLSTTPLPPHGIFDAQSILDASAWRAGLPRRWLGRHDGGWVEVASLGAAAALTLHDPRAPASMPLPGGNYVDGASKGTTLALISRDESTYRSQLLVIDADASSLGIRSVDTFVGQAVSVELLGERAFVADAEGIVWVFGLYPEETVLLDQVPMLGDAGEGSAQ